MPELPEVETIKRELLKTIKGKKIKEVKIRLSKMINLKEKEFKSKVEGSRIIDIKRRAKFLIIELTNGFSLVIHLKLTGQLIYKSKELKTQSLELKYTHLIFYFSDGSKLLYNDLRQFGWMKLLTNKELENLLEKEKFGPEPLDKNFNLEKFKELLSKKKRQKIKPLLIDQTFIAGIGNIYSQEACFYAKVSPSRLSGDLNDKEIEDLYQGIKKILTGAIKHKGSSVDTYLDIYGEKGEYIPFLKVYERGGEKCVRCGSTLKEAKIAGRGTVWCPGCQK